MTPTDPHVLVSCIREVAAAVDELQAALETGGINVWRDREDLGLGDA